MVGLISVNGVIYPPEKAQLPALDRGFLFGDAVFETFVAFHGKILDMDRHLVRLRESADALGMTIPWQDAELAFELGTLAEELGVPKLSLRLVVTRGNGLGLRVPKDAKPNRVIYCFKTNEEPAATYKEGYALKRVAKGVTERGAAPKTASYLQSVIAVQRAEAQGFHDILWTNADNEITEASTANVFFMARDGDNFELITPPAMSGILLGITRATLIRLMKAAGIPVREQIVYADELARFDECFVCSTVRGLVPIAKIDSHRLHTAREGSVFRHLERLYLTWVETELGFRVDWNSGRKV